MSRTVGLSVQAPNLKGPRNPLISNKTRFCNNKTPRFRPQIRAKPNGSHRAVCLDTKTQIPCKLAPRHNLHGQPKPRIRS